MGVLEPAAIQVVLAEFRPGDEPASAGWTPRGEGALANADDRFELETIGRGPFELARALEERRAAREVALEATVRRRVGYADTVLALSDGSWGIRAAIAHAGLVLLDEPSGPAGRVDSEDFHVYRLVLAASGMARLFVDGRLHLEGPARPAADGAWASVGLGRYPYSQNVSPTRSEWRTVRVLSGDDLAPAGALAEAPAQRVLPEPVIDAARIGLYFSPPALSLGSLARRVLRRGGADRWWALRDVSFRVAPGELVGVIGRNGAGKSTLLRIVAGVLPPDEGRLVVRGRPLLVSPGVGFREELTGRDNVRFGLTLLGVPRAERERLLDGIVDFAGLRDAIDRPFKHYSDGMKARLMFSVATAASPDVLLLDELLGAGDAGFAAQARDRLEELIGRARAIFLVTHNYEFVRERCTRALYLVAGRVRFFGDPGVAVELYLRDVYAAAE